MSWACSTVAPKAGIAVPGSIAGGFRIQFTSWAGMFTSRPLMNCRSAHRVSGGPTSPPGPRTPGIMWQLRQPNALSSSFPRAGSPRMRASAAARVSPTHRTVTVSCGSAPALTMRRYSSGDRRFIWRTKATMAQISSGVRPKRKLGIPAIFKPKAVVQ
jgi:hypothetical protein